MKRLLTYLIVAICQVGLLSADPITIPPPNTHSTGPITSISRPIISPQEWQELNEARSATLKANPDLLAKMRALSMKMKAFQDKLSAAMQNEDPRVGPILDQLQHRTSPVQLAPKPVPQVLPIPSPTR